MTTLGPIQQPTPSSLGRLIAAALAGLVAGAVGFVVGIWLVTLDPRVSESKMSIVVPLLLFGIAATAAVQLVGKIGRPSTPLPVPDLASGEPPLLYMATLLVLRRMSDGQTRWGFLFSLTLVLFVLTRRSGESPIQIASLVAVLFLHELGHLTTMRAFGYRDTRIFFIPGLGAATGGDASHAPGWQRAIVGLAGPLPGLVAGVFWLRGTQHATPDMQYPGTLLVWINAFNLLPLEPLDGGKLLNTLVFSWHPWLETIFVGVTSIALGAIGLQMGTTLFLAFGMVGLLLLPSLFRSARTGAAVRSRWPTLPERLRGDDDEFTRDLFREAFPIAARIQTPNAVNMAWLMRNSFERAQCRPASWPTTVAVLVIYGLSVMFALYAVSSSLAPPTAS